MGLINVNDLSSKLEGVVMDPAENFLNGKVTSPFKKSPLMNSVSIVGGTMRTGTSIASIVTHPDDIYKEVRDEIGAIVLEKANEEIQKVLQKLKKEAISITLSIPEKIAKYTAEQFNEDKKSLNDIMASMCTDAEIQRKIKADKTAKDAQEEQKKEITQKIEDAQKKVSDVTNKIDQGVKMVCTYIDAGPEWVTSKVNAVLDDGIKRAENAANSGLSIARKKIDEFCEGQGEAIGKRMAIEYNDHLKKVAQNQRNKIENTQAEAKISANIAIQKGILTIMAMTGISIPFTPSI